MHPSTVLVLACLCVVYAQNIPSMPAVYRSMPKLYPGLKDWPKTPSERPHHVFTKWAEDIDPGFIKTPVYNTKLLYHPTPDYQNSEWQRNSKSPWDVQTDEASYTSEEVHSPQHNAFDDAMLNYPKPWNAPPYYQSLKDYNEAVTKIKSHFTRDAFTYNDDKNFQYIVIIATVDYLSKTVAERGWDSYDQNYTSLVRSAMERTFVDPYGAVKELDCTVFTPSRQKLQKIKAIIYNPILDFVCKAQPTACDTVIYTVLQTTDHEELEKASELLLSMGEAASTFLKAYANAFEAISTQNAFVYILKSSEILRDLVAKTAEARKVLHPNGTRPCYF